MKITKREFLLSSSAAAVVLAGGFGALAKEKTMAKPTVDKASLVIRKADSLSEKDVLEWLKAMRGRPYVKQSGFDVTSVFKVKSGGEAYYVGGANVENIDLVSGTCAEEGAIAAAVGALGQEADIVEGWVMGAPRGATTSDLAVYPCGECRQRIAQYTAPTAPIHIVGLDGEMKNTKTRAELIPNAFSFRDLSHNDVAAATALASEARQLIREVRTPLGINEIYEWMGRLQPDVRVSGVKESVVLRLENGAYVAGVKIENAAYPSSTMAMQSAVAVMNLAFGPQKIAEVWNYGAYTIPEKGQETAYIPLTGSSLQILAQFADGTVPVNTMNSQGNVKTVSLQELLSTLRNFETPFSNEGGVSPYLGNPQARTPIG